jgi:hypothetical protein
VALTHRAGCAALLVIALAAEGARAEGAASAPACPPRGTPVLSVELVDPEPRVLSPLSAATLRAEAGGEDDGPFPHHLGLTISRVEWRSEITVRSRGPQGGPVCAVPAEVRLRLVQAEHTIRLAREVPPGGCLAGEVLAHERRHAEVNRRTLREASSELRSIARAWAARAEKRASDAGAAALALQDELGEVLDPVLDRLRTARDAAHAQIDSQAEYRRLSRVCASDQARLRAALRRR